MATAQASTKDEATSLGEDRLKELLVEHAAHNERLLQEIGARDYERSQMLQLLHRKDEQLGWQEQAVTRQKAVLQVTRNHGRYYRVLCMLRAWRDLVQRGRAWRALERTKDQLTVAKLRHSCSTLCSTLQQVMSRQLKCATDVLWLHSCSTELWVLNEDQSKRPTDEDTIDLLGCEALHVGCLSAANTCHSVVTQSPSKDMLDDQSLYMTPRRTAPQVRQPHWEPSPMVKTHRLGNPSPFSDASTYAPSSCSRANAMGSCFRNPAAVTQVAWMLQNLLSRRLFWALQQFQRSCSWGCKYTAHAAAATSEAEAAASHAAERVTAVSERLKVLESSEEQDRQKSSEQLEALRECCEGLEHHVEELAGSESKLGTQLHEVHAHLEVLDGQESFLEQQLFNQQLEEQAVAHRERCASNQLELGLRQVQDRLCKIELACEEQERSSAERQECLQQTQTAGARLEAQVAQQAAWRREAEQQITDMVSRGQVLERERVRLLGRIAEAQKAHLVCKEQHDVLQRAFGREEHAGEILHARAKALEEDNVELNHLLQQERQKHHQVIASKQRELRSLRSALQAAREERRTAQVQAQRRVEEAACQELRRAWEHDRQRAAREREGLHSQLNLAEQELSAARCSEEAAAQAAAVEHAGKNVSRGGHSDTTFGATSPRHEGQLHSDRWPKASLCEQLSVQLQERLAVVEALQARLEARSCLTENEAAGASFRSPRAGSAWPIKSASAAVGSAWLLVSQHLEGADNGGRSCASSQQTSGTQAQIDELDGYVMLVERLQSELKAERSEREASGQALASLRLSYRQLLKSAVAATPAASPAVTPRLSGSGCAAGVQDVANVTCPGKPQGIGVVS